MHISDFLVKDLPEEVLACDLSLLHYHSLKAVKAAAVPLITRYPKEVATLRYLHHLHHAVDFEVLLGDVGRELLWQEYLEKGCQGVADVLGVCFNSGQRLSRRFGFQDKAHSAARLQYRRHRDLGPNPFVEESALKWYLYGFILGDGSLVAKNPSNVTARLVETVNGDVVEHFRGLSLSLVLSSKDLSFLQGFSKFFPQGKLGRPYKGCYCFTLYDRGVCDSLLQLGVYPRKSFSGALLPLIPETYFPVMLLGLLDSDGWVALGNKGRSLRLGWCGHPSYLREIFERLRSYCPSASFRVRVDGLGLINLHRTTEQVLLCNLMYKEAPYFLPRKYERVKTVLGSHGFSY